MIDDIRGIEADASGRIADAGSLEALSEVERDLLGKESQLTGFKRRLGALEPDARREAGAALNATRQAVEALVGARRAELDAAAEDLLTLGMDGVEIAELLIEQDAEIHAVLAVTPRPGE